MSTWPTPVLPATLAELHPDAWTAPFWEAAHARRLVCARCELCGTYRMPPSPFCPNCRSQQTTWEELSGRGSVYTFTVVRHAVIPEMRDHVPYVVAVIDLEDAPGTRLIADVVGVDPDHVHIGLAVRVVWDEVAEGVTIPRFEPHLDAR
jgi:uncharacterized OB-fold protein